MLSVLDERCSGENVDTDAFGTVTASVLSGNRKNNIIISGYNFLSTNSTFWSNLSLNYKKYLPLKNIYFKKTIMIQIKNSNFKVKIFFIK